MPQNGGALNQYYSFSVQYDAGQSDDQKGQRIPMPMQNMQLSANSTAKRRGAGGEAFLIGGITMAAILLLVGTGANWLSGFWGIVDYVGQSRGATASTLILNIALILFGWRRFAELSKRAELSSRSEAEARQLAMTDPLTGFYNRAAFQALGKQALIDWRTAGLTPAALMVDIDAFKSVNDLFGHDQGDKVIRITAERILSCIPANAIPARVGGDEFIILLPIGAETHPIDDYGQIMASVLSYAIDIDQSSISTSSSVGGALAMPDEGLDTLLRHADNAMYQAKRTGRCRFVRFCSKMNAALRQRDVIERELRIALERGDIYPVYEAMIDLTSGETLGYEMLARWNNAALGQIAPVDFIPVAEETGMIARLSEQLMRRSFAEARDWPEGLSLAVNISPLQLRDPWFAQKLLKLLAETGFPAQRLIIEITESAIVDNIALARTIFESLRNQGIRIALDDFGTGYNSVANLRSLPFDTIKLDREFVTSMDNDAGRTAIAQAVLKLGQAMGLPVVAEGIESNLTATMLANFDCAVGQGHYFSKELRHEDVLAAHRPGGERRRA